MKKTLIENILIFFFLFALSIPGSFCQEKGEDIVMDPIRLTGPRVGFTIITGSLSKELREDHDAFPIVTQFGWQFETQFYTLENGSSGLIEGILLFGGLEQGLFLPSVSGIIGFRSKEGVEFGIGPNLSVTGFGMVIAAGINFHSENINFPINLAILPTKEGVRFTILMGFNVRRR